ncbi:uncharacterized protein SPAPADRAFT_142855 [Spathaspora passalidarum NRRL Y-27907]|uniref:Uncharacterized protein n=1 Tax=Spathaspora passalidarum (strain NRRL Y-27907 / 11-Y1) TaxID=619300 RepID=G3AST6_SPAPN|nr:uncharacterized protein SPAPADRAFT_142855 [Spathaspora passalidarum NRRL Y-27907]EGW31151.1 hypothetical protein SPAPADRAFT_142855 [Spathaspora passalidarum NRRL Y-27907]
MITRTIPPLDSELQAQFSLIIQNKTFDQSKSEVSWEKDILPKLLTRLDQLVILAKNQQESGEDENTDELVKSIESNHERIKSHINAFFQQSPPFTITRIAEVINDPEKEGYSIANNAKLVKYFNSLKKLVLVSSSIDDFPQVNVPDNENGEKTEPVVKVVGQSAATIPLIEIPWLSQNDSENNNKVEENLEIEPKLHDSNGVGTKAEEGEEPASDQPADLHENTGEHEPKKRKNGEAVEKNEDSKRPKPELSVKNV